MSNAASVAARSRSLILLLLVISVCINYIDRGNLSVAADQLSRELNMDPQQLGKLLSSFFMTYAAFQIVAGWLVDRYNVYWVYGWGFFLWSLATAVTGWANTFSMLFVARLVLGMAESVAYPCYSKILAGGFEEKKRGFANAVIDAGSKCGPALGLLLGGMLIAKVGWRMMFVGIGLGSMIWLIPWVILTPKQAGRNVKTDEHVPGILEILSKRDAWGTFLALFCINYAWYFLLTWMPFYLVRERHYSTEMMAQLGSLPFWGVAAASLTGGILSDRWISRGGSPTLVRKFFVVSGLCTATLMLPAAIAQNQVFAMTLLIIAATCFGLTSSNHWAITQTLAGPAAAGRWTGLQNGFGNLAGIAAPWFTGWIVKETGQFFYAFVATAVILLLGAAAFLFVVGPVQPVQWRGHSKSLAVNI
ncbi:MAG TPA: MFS transporter [Bryobacteraceae bacterium]|nr:MFS transporter [Bryobacteraceae bacterium]